MKHFRPILCLILLAAFLAPSILSASTAGAQSKDTLEALFQRVDKRLYRSQHKAKIDPEYIAIPENRWTIQTSLNLSRNYFDAFVQQPAKSEDELGKILHLDLQSALDVAPSISVAWRGLSIGASINPAWFFKHLKNEDQSYGISVYGNRFGMAAGIRSMTTLDGDVISHPDSSHIGHVPARNCYDLSADFDAYYAINGSRFSMPAAFNRSQIQKKSAGSPMISLSIRNKFTKLGKETHIGVDSVAMFYNILCAGGGYGQNWVTRHNWLLHVSGLFNLSLLKYNMDWINGEENKQLFPLSDFVATARVSFTRFMQKKYYGIDVIWRNSYYNIWSGFPSATSYIDAHIVFGWRF
jgi:hypothetical protein